MLTKRNSLAALPIPARVPQDVVVAHGRYAIAYAVLRHLSAAVDCRLLFATHYHPLTAEFEHSSRVALGHMAALVGTPQALPTAPTTAAAAGQGGSSAERLITFLYELRPGACPRSYGLQVRGQLRTACTQRQHAILSTWTCRGCM